MSSTPPCRVVQVMAFRGDRSRPRAAAFQRALDDERNGHGPGPSPIECLLFAGHAGVTTNGGAAIYGFNPDGGGLPVWQLLDRLKNGDAFPAVVRDDAFAFATAQKHGLPVLSFEVILPEPRFQEVGGALDAERRNSQYSYGFPNGDGDCNCITWLERLGLPLLTGRMDEFIGLTGWTAAPSRRFGRCV